MWTEIRVRIGVMGRSRRSRSPRPAGSPAPSGGRVDLHNLRPEQALRELERALHTSRVRGDERLTVITGRGFGNRSQEPILRRQVEAWLGSDGRRYGVRSFEPVSRGGALEVRLGPAAAGDSPGASAPEPDGA